MISIKSARTDRELRLSNYDNDNLTVELLGNPNFKTSAYIYTAADQLKGLLTEIGNAEVPWDGVKIWTTLEHEFTIEISCSALGQVLFEIEIADGYVGEESTTLQTSIETELGLLPKIAKQANELLS